MIYSVAPNKQSCCYWFQNTRRWIESMMLIMWYDILRSVILFPETTLIELMHDGIIFWGRSSNVNKLFILQKKIVRIITNSRVRESCREALKYMQIMTLYSQYIFSLILFTVKNKPLFTPNNEIHKYKLGTTLTYIYQLLI